MSTNRALERYKFDSNNNTAIQIGLLEDEAASVAPLRDLQRMSHSPETIPIEIIDDLIIRFLVNLPESEMVSAPRIF
jgi:hypothetical protein